MQSESLPSTSLIGKNRLSSMWVMWWLGIAMGSMGLIVLRSSAQTVEVLVGRVILVLVFIVYLLIFFILSIMTYTVELTAEGISIKPRVIKGWNWLIKKRFEEKRLEVKGVRRMTNTKVLLRINGWYSILVTGTPREIEYLLEWLGTME